MGLRSTKSRVLVQFWILFFLAMLFIGGLMLSLFLERSLARYADQKRLTLMIACENQRPLFLAPHAAPPREERTVLSTGDRLLVAAALSALPVDDQEGSPWRALETAVYQTLETGQATTSRVSAGRGLLFFQDQSLIVTYPIQSEGVIIAAGGLESHLAGIFQDVRRIQKIVFVFIVISSLFFALFGNHRFARIYYRPLQRLAKRAETYRDEADLFFAVRKEDNEFAVLSSSLNQMLHRIADDKRVLNETITALKTANLELKKAQNDVIRAEKLATVGRLTSGIAHEIGNPIGIVLGYLDLLKQTDLTPEERDDFIVRSEKEITRIHHIIRQLLDMSRASTDESKPISIRLLLQDLISVLNYQPAAHAIRFESLFEADDDRVCADPDRLRQVFLNILLNAVDALNSHACASAGEKTITVRTTADTQTPEARPGHWIRVIIHDNGPGIPSADLAHVFDPFFTTKQPGKGTGLGLSVSFMIVEKLGGHLSVSSSPETGALFEVALPLSTDRPLNDVQE